MKKLCSFVISVMAGIFGLQAITLRHPCLLHTQADFDYVKDRLGEEPYASALVKLKGSPYAKTSYTPSPVEYLARLDANNWSQLNWRWEDAGIAHLWYDGIHANYTLFMRDAAAAYQLALLYKLEDNKAAANAAKNIMVQWSKTNKGILVNSKGEIIDPNERLMMFQPYQMAVAAEMLRDYNGWGQSQEFKNVVEWLDKSFYWVAKAQLDLQNESGGGHYWMNWDLAAMTTVLALGVLEDNASYINEAINYFKGKGGGPGNIFKGVPYLHEDPDSEEMLGQGNELGRDQGHNTLCAAVLGTFCQMGLAIGEDLFAFDDYRALKFAEYVAKYNLGQEDLYPDPMQNFSSMNVGNDDSDFVYPHSSFPYTTYTYGDGGRMTEPSQASRGSVRPGWDYWTGYANGRGLSSIYSSAMAERIRPDGGGGHYSANSGGFDQIGFSTLMGYRPYEQPEADYEPQFDCVGDTWIRQDSKGVVNGNGPKIELRSIDVKDEDGNITATNYHVGLLAFNIDIPEDKTVVKAELHLVTERVKGGDVRVYEYNNDFDEDKANWNIEERYAENPGNPILSFTAAGQKGKAIYDGGITADRRNLDAWTNDIDITDYIKLLPMGTKRLNFLLKEDGDQVCFFSKDNVGQEKAFKDTPETTDFISGELKPYLKLYLNDYPEDPDDEDFTVVVEIVEPTDSTGEYFTIQGIKVNNPEPGELYIKKTRHNTEKILYLK